MTTVTQQSMWDVVEPLPEDKKRQVFNFAIQLGEAEKTKAEKIAEIEADMDRCQQWAKEVGLTPDDITKAIKTVRRRKRAQA